MRFLKEVAAFLEDNSELKPEDTLIITPNQRTGIFLTREIVAQSSSPTILPKTITVEEFMESHTSLTLGDPLELNLLLYKVFQSHLNLYESFDKFYYWGEMLIRDFNDIDKNLVNAKDLFGLMQDEKEIDRQFQYLLPEQIEVIKKFWNSFSPPDYDNNQQTFIDTWKSLYPIYTEYNEELKNQQLAYSGMIFKDVSEKLLSGKLTLPFQKILFVGFHILSVSEEKIFRFCKKNNQGLFFWDVDSYYLDEKNSHIRNHEAGYFLRKYIKEFTNSANTNNFLETPPNVHFISCPKVSGQTFSVKDIIEKNNIPYNEKTAVILPQENALIPLLQAITKPNEPINITLGYSLKNSTIVSLLEHWIDIFKYKSKEKFYYKPILKFLNNAYVRQIHSTEVAEFEAYILNNNLLYIETSDFDKFPFLKQFLNIDLANTLSSLESFGKFIENVYYFYFDSENTSSSAHFETEILYQAHLALNKLEGIVKEPGLTLEQDTLKKLIYKYLNNVSINFSGEPVLGLQVMGLLESRNLDFDNVFILNTNEGILPANISSGSYIPYHLRSGFGLPTYRNNDSMYSYYIYRLLHQSKNIYFLYNNIVNERTRAEPSRYIVQLKLESGLPYKEYIHTSEFISPDNKAISINKSPEVLEKLERFYREDSNSRLTPSSLNVFIDCKLKFYFKYVENIQEPDTITEEIDPSTFGNLLHNALQNLYNFYSEKFGDNPLTLDTIGGLEEMVPKAVQISIAETFSKSKSNKAIELVGDHYLMFDILEKYVKKIIEYDRGFLPLNIPLIEEDYRFEEDVKVGTKTMKVHIGGRVDRIDLAEDQIKVVDYKTGISEGKNTFTHIQELFDSQNPKRKEYIFQIFLYSYLLSKNTYQNRNIIPQLLFIRDSYQTDFNASIYHKKDKNSLQVVDSMKEYMSEFAAELEKLLQDLFDTEVPFDQTKNIDKCKFCPYVSICNREQL